MENKNNLLVKRYRKKPIGMKTNWSLINNKRTINLLDGLLNNEAISQLNNNYSFSKITNPISEIRNEIGFDSIQNYRIKGLRCEEYRLINSEIVRKKVLKLKNKILNHIVKKNNSCATKHL